MKTHVYVLFALLASTLALGACSEHNCSLDTESDRKKFGDLAPATSGANSCFVSNGELVATHPDKSVDEVADAYKRALEAKKYDVTVEKHEGQRANGKSYEGKRLMLEKGDKQAGVVIYPLTEGIIETVTVVRE
jgi:hypothetical protein